MTDRLHTSVHREIEMIADQAEVDAVLACADFVAQHGQVDLAQAMVGHFLKQVGKDEDNQGNA